MRFGSVCSGIEAASAAWLPLGWRCQFMPELQAFPRAVLSHHYPETPLHGDFTTIQAGQYGSIDVLVGGTPCQSFSVAGLRGGMADARGNLALEYLRLAERLRPRWIVWENVPGVLSSADGRDFGSFVGGLAECGYGWAYRILDAQYFGLAQRRKRVFVVGYLGDWRRAAAVLFEPESLRGHPAPRREARERIADSLTVGANQCSGFPGDITHVANPLGAKRDGGWRGDLDNDTYAIQERAVSENPDAGPQGAGFQADVAYTLEARHHVQAVARSLNAHAGGRYDGESETFVTGTLTGNGDTHSGRDYKARPVDVAQPVMAAGPGMGDQGGDVLVTQAFPDPAFALSAGAQDRGGVFGSGRDGQDTFVTYSLRADGFDAGEDGTGRGTPFVAFAQNQRDEVRQMDVAGALASEPGMKQQTYVNTSAVRRLTPEECEKLQGFSPGYTAIPYRGKPAADGPRYRALGNSMAVPCMRWIGERIEALR